MRDVPFGTAAHHADRVFVTAMALALIGLLTLMSAAAFLPTSSGDAYHGDPYRLVKRQAVCLLIALAVYCVVRHVPFPLLDRAARAGLIAVVALLVLVLLPGLGPSEARAHRWLRLGPVSFQASEFAKLGLIVFLAHHLSRFRGRLNDFGRGVLPPVGVILLLSGLVALEPDLGTAVLMGSVGFMMLVVAGVRVRHLVPFACLGLPALLGFMALKFSHVVARLKAFLDPMGCYQTRQSLLALGHGGVFGAGLGAGRQKLAFLPQVHGDFLFASLGEELGLLGCLTVLGLFAALVVFSVRLLAAVRDPFRFFVGVGIVGLIGLQAAMNMAVVTASVPPKGIALPFLSQGGTSLLVMVGGLALLVGAGDPAATGGADGPRGGRRPGLTPQRGKPTGWRGS